MPILVINGRIRNRDAANRLENTARMSICSDLSENGIEFDSEDNMIRFRNKNWNRMSFDRYAGISGGCFTFEKDAEGETILFKIYLDNLLWIHFVVLVPFLAIALLAAGLTLETRVVLLALPTAMFVGNILQTISRTRAFLVRSLHY